MIVSQECIDFPNLGFPVTPRSWTEIAKIAFRNRCEMGYCEEEYLPLNHIESMMQRLDSQFVLLAEDKEKMGAKEGIAQPWSHCIILREDVIQDLEDGKPRARFTLAHELGHYQLHANELCGLARNKISTWPGYCDSEKQANAYGARLLMPKHMLLKYNSADDIAKVFGVSSAELINKDKFK